MRRAMNFIAHAKRLLLLHSKNQATCHNALLLLQQREMFQPWSRPGEPHHVLFHVPVLSSCKRVPPSILLAGRRSSKKFMQSEHMRKSSEVFMMNEYYWSLLQTAPE